MKIAVYHNLPPGGAKRVLFEEIKYLSKHHQIFLFELASTDEEFLDIRGFCKEVRRYKIERRRTQKLKKIYRDFWIITTLREVHKKIAKDIDSSSFDVVLVHPDLYTQAPFVLKYVKTPSVYYCHEWLRIAYEKEFRFVEKVSVVKKVYESFSRFMKKRIDSENTRKARMVIVNSEFTKRNVKMAYHINAEIAYPGVDTEVFKKEADKKKKQILFMGAKDEVNGYSFIEKAMQYLPKYYFLKVADISEIKSVSDMQLASLYRESFVFVSMSLNEPFGLAALESMACGTPVIAINQGGYKETVEDGITGYLVNKNPEKIAEKVIELENKDTYRGISENGVIRTREKWTWKKHSNTLEELFTKLIKKQ
ncbi:MAG TPA: glycosyltransferase family 4 protein [Candidatus Levybacteria bacterium]|nr:glycosyltransferase family 4 protein [Candidatus Levybacteria bacterium]